MKRVVFDTNIWVSAFAFGGEVRQIVELALEYKIQPVTSPDLLRELEKVLLSRKIALPAGAVHTIIREIQFLSIVIEPSKSLKVILKDPSDDRVLECAVEGKADFIASGDGHLLDLGVFHRIPIFTPRRFLEMMGA